MADKKNRIGLLLDIFMAFCEGQASKYLKAKDIRTGKKKWRKNNA